MPRFRCYACLLFFSCYTALIFNVVMSSDMLAGILSYCEFLLHP